jgi:hydrogenase-4 transcriptional activator
MRNSESTASLEPRLEPILLELWRESCRHIQLDQSAPALAQILSGAISFDRMCIRIADEKHSQIYSVVERPLREQPNDQRKSLTKQELKQLLDWIRSGGILTWAETRAGTTIQHRPGTQQQPGKHQPGTQQQPRTQHQTGTLQLLIPLKLLRDGDLGDVLAVPLHEQSCNAGLLLIREHPRRFDQWDIDVAAKIAEPLAVAIANHHRMHEIASLREAAEADKGALLRRLGRTDLGDPIIGERTGLRKVMERVQLVAASDAPVMILGETGSGKEVIARALHLRGARRDGPFIRVNCGAIPAELIDSQLFGHEKGAFTGADHTRLGWFERADGGTLFLDEIGELPLQAQVRFLRVLQDGFIERVGSDKPVHVDVRVVAATHRDLASMVADRKFREDLWYRVAVFPILLPPLRERGADIPELANHFAERAATRFGLSPVAPSAEDIRLLQSYHWPGNIRELGAVMDRAAILGEGQTLEVAVALGLNRERLSATAKPPLAEMDRSNLLSRVVQSNELPEDCPVDLSIDSAMRRHIERVLRMTRGKVEGPGGAAELLKINPHTLRGRMRKLSIDWVKFRNCDWE